MYKQKHKQPKFKYSGENSYVANRPLQQIEIDLIDMTKIASENDGYRYAVTGVDIFSLNTDGQCQLKRNSRMMY